MNRKQTPDATETQVLESCARRCALCYGLNGDLGRKKGQVAHIARDPSNSSEGNLVFLCFDHHDEHDSRTSQAKGITKLELATYKAKLEAAIDNGEHHRGVGDGAGGRGGGGNAVGNRSLIVGGRGGKGGTPCGGRGGDGGGGDAVGQGSVVIGGDGGDASRIDGRGGAGGASPLKGLSPELLESFGLTGDEGYGQGGTGANSAEYERSLRVLSLLAAEYVAAHPHTRLIPMPGVLMPPAEWVNGRLSQMQESFRVEFIDNATDFRLRPASKA